MRMALETIEIHCSHLSSFPHGKVGTRASPLRKLQGKQDSNMQEPHACHTADPQRVDVTTLLHRGPRGGKFHGESQNAT